MATAIAVIGAVATVAGTVNGINQQRRAQRASDRQQALVSRRSRRQAIRSAQIRRAQSIAGAQASGVAESSSALGGIGSIGSQLGEQIGFANAVSGLSAEINRANRAASDAQAVAGIGGALFNTGVRFGANFNSLFPQRRTQQGNNTSGFLNPDLVV